jgi:hypothetical protein
MTPHSLSPAFVRFDYVSRWAAHAALLGTKEWLPTSITGTMGSYVNWNAVPIDAEDMIDNITVGYGLQFPSTTTMVLATIYTQASAHAPALPVASKVLSVAGTNAVGGPDKATQVTLNMRSTGINPAKIVLLDVPVGTSNFDKVFPGSFPAGVQAIWTSLHSTNWAWSARDDTRILTAISMTITLNERLRREYRQA